MKSWKKRLNEEFKAAVPALKSEVINAPVKPVASVETEEKPEKKRFSALKKRLFFGSGFAAAALAAVFTVLGLTGVFAPSVTPEIKRCVFTLDINPSVAFVTDEDGKVICVNSLNEDADVVLSGENARDKLINVYFSEAVETFADAAAKTGYLDISKEENAVKLSYGENTDETLVGAAAESLQNYFKQKGVYVVVVKKSLTIRELCEKTGVAVTDKVKELSDELEKISAFFTERLADDTSFGDFEKLYNENIVGKTAFGLVKEELLLKINDIVESALLLQKIYACNANIYLSTDNPGGILKRYDYWGVKNDPDLTYSEDFAALMTETEELLDEYEQKFDKKITSYEELKSARDLFDSFKDIDLKEYLSALTLDDFQKTADKYITILEEIGCDFSALKAIVNAPKTAEEYFAQLRAVEKQTFLFREERFADIYSAPREEISAVDYDEYIKGIIEKFGSLENFWDYLQ